MTNYELLATPKAQRGLKSSMLQYLNRSVIVEMHYFEAERFRDADPSFCRLLKSHCLSVFNPMSVILYVAIKSEREGKRQKYVDMFKIVDKLFNNCNIRGTLELITLNHDLLWQILLQETLILRLL